MVEVRISVNDRYVTGDYHKGIAGTNCIALLLFPGGVSIHGKDGEFANSLYQQFVDRGFSTLKIDTQSTGAWDAEACKMHENTIALESGVTALNWLENHNEERSSCVVIGVESAAWACMQLVMRRPEIGSFAIISPNVISHDFSFLAPCPIGGLVVSDTHSSETSEMEDFINKLRVQKGDQVVHVLVEEDDMSVRTRSLNAIKGFIDSLEAPKAQSLRKTSTRRRKSFIAS